VEDTWTDRQLLESDLILCRADQKSRVRALLNHLKIAFSSTLSDLEFFLHVELGLVALINSVVMVSDQELQVEDV